MKSIHLIALLLILSSCITVHFSEPQPRGAERLYKVPEELHGNWKTYDEGREINEFGLISSQSEYDDSLAEYYDEYVIIDTSYDYTYLGDSIRLYKTKDFYVYNFLDEIGSWNIIVIDLDKEGSINFYAPNHFTALSKFRGLKVDSVKTRMYVPDAAEDESSFIYEIVAKPNFANMTDEELEDVTDIYTSGQMKKRDIKKLIRNENYLESYKADGTIFYPSDTAAVIDEYELDQD